MLKYKISVKEFSSILKQSKIKVFRSQSDWDIEFSLLTHLLSVDESMMDFSSYSLENALSKSDFLLDFHVVQKIDSLLEKYLILTGDLNA